MRVVITGSRGQLGHELIRGAPASAIILGLDLPEIDICDTTKLSKVVAEFRPSVIINAAAYTNVDKAESEVDLAFAVNSTAAQQLAAIARNLQSRLIHISTDFVFDGLAGRAYLPSDVVSPLSVYGRSKADAERHVLSENPNNTIVIRTAWVYSTHGGNFVKTIIRLLQERDQIRIISDQIGTPTWAGSLARCIWTFASRPETGIWHYTDAGVASWYDFAVAIAYESHRLGIIPRMKPIIPITTSEFPTAARRPSFGVLDKSSTWPISGQALHWHENLRQMLSELGRNNL